MLTSGEIPDAFLAGPPRRCTQGRQSGSAPGPSQRDPRYVPRLADRLCWAGATWRVYRELTLPGFWICHRRLRALRFVLRAVSPVPRPWLRPQATAELEVGRCSSERRAASLARTRRLALSRALDGRARRTSTRAHLHRRCWESPATCLTYHILPNLERLLVERSAQRSGNGGGKCPAAIKIC